MNISNIPFIFVFASLFFPIISAYTQSLFISYLIDISIFLIFIYFLIFVKNFNLKRNYIILILSPILFHTLFMSMLGKTIANKSIIGLLILTYIFFIFLIKGDPNNQAKNIFKQIQYIYIFLIGGLLLEALLRITGFGDMLFYPISTLNATNQSIKLYKFYNAAYLFQYLGFKDMTGLNSILLGSQIASQIIANGIIIFSPIYLKAKEKLISDKNFLFFASLIFYPFVATLTSNLILVLIFFVVLFILPNSKLNNYLSQIKTFLITIISFPFLSSLILFRISSQSDFTSYYKTFIAPVDEFLKLDLFSKLFGVGLTELQYVDTSGDFGLGILIINIGLLPVSFLLISFLFLFKKTIFNINLAKNQSIQNNPWVYLASVNILCATSWVISLVHYTPAIELGGRQIFAFHLAIAWLSLYRLKKITSNIDMNSNNMLIKN
tara:strand:- start:1387 stop:2697 length:1311 start_codon:yes stop_codon:yes gene_type:complete